LFARDVQLDAIEALGSSRVAMPFSVATRCPFTSRRASPRIDARRPLVASQAIGQHGKRISGEGPQLDRAAHAMRGADPGDADVPRHRHAPTRLLLGGCSCGRLGCCGGGRCGCGFGSRLALRSLRGSALSGLLRAARFTTPAASRKRVTRSEGCAPLASQLLTLSIRASARLIGPSGSSGLKWPRRSMKRPVARKARVGDDDVIDRALLGACASEADND